MSSRSGASIARMALSMWMYDFQNFCPRAYMGVLVGVSSKCKLMEQVLLEWVWSGCDY